MSGNALTQFFRRNARLSAEPRTSALPEMATAVIILDEFGEVEYVNGSADELFFPVHSVGCTLPALLASCGARGGENIFGAGIDTRDTTCRLLLADGRILDGTMRKLSNGGFVLSLDDVTTHVQNAEEALRDALTGLPNRRRFIEHLTESVVDAAQTNRTVALLLIDLDRFKAVNDSLGHPIGDGLLRKVAGRLRNALGGSDLAARFGGDEFAVIQVGSAQPEGAQVLATRLVDLLSRAYLLEGHTLHVGATIGFAVYPTDGDDAETLFKHADLALYAAKSAGRGVHRSFEPEMNRRVQTRRLLEIDLRRALALKELRLVYQPQIDLSTGQISGFEALIRWDHPERGLVSPAEFITLAEEIGIIVPISEWVLRTACKEAVCWPESVSVAVNISPVQFRSGRLAQTVISALAQAGLSAERLHLEITECALLDQTDDIRQIIAALKQVGVKLAMDDFGTGYSSLSYLQQFPFDQLKIDRSFVQNIDQNVERLAVLRAIVDMSAALGIATVAEGVETSAELECVRSARCGQVQGYLTGRPMSSDAVPASLRSVGRGASNE